MSWADRIAYVCHDFEDAASAGLVSVDDLPASVRDLCGTSRRHQLGVFIHAMIETTLTTGAIGMDPDTAGALGEFRHFNYERIYMREASRRQAQRVVGMLRALVEHYQDHPESLPADASSPDHAATDVSLAAAVDYVAGMTDRFACRAAVSLLDWPIDQLPSGIDR